ncbi:hypothetical protein [Pukyongiella litopenaei]|uniref:Uncharacterized protein n=1 Tax=Pukyongiella litopenaei TaxID=2605946 RepID=A0A2S0MNS0_9RHOB|nr:hypothetical protein [Pukyongiella litopenaei]AVO37363.1 hypothetical protein C6Y53_06330 [Pukyongiella litopenaei]
MKGQVFAPPEIGTEVRFQRSPSHHPENGTVRGRQFGTGIIEVRDETSKSVSLKPGQYEIIATSSPQLPTRTHGRQQPPPATTPPYPSAGGGTDRISGWWILPAAIAGALLWADILGLL